MGKPYSIDLRERVVAAVETGGMSCHRAAAQFGVGVSKRLSGCGACVRPAASRLGRWALHILSKDAGEKPAKKAKAK
jgi:transposase